jgi:hypothetical protein
LAADAVLEGLNRGDTSGRQLGKWAEDFQAGSQSIRKLVDAFYTNECSFETFVQEKPGQVANLIDLLIGPTLRDEAGRRLHAMGSHFESLAKTPK